MTTLTLQARAHDGESIASFCSRTAALHGAESASDFWWLFGLSFGELSKGASNVMGGLQAPLGPAFMWPKRNFPDRCRPGCSWTSASRTFRLAGPGPSMRHVSCRRRTKCDGEAR